MNRLLPVVMAISRCRKSLRRTISRMEGGHLKYGWHHKQLSTGRSHICWTCIHCQHLSSRELFAVRGCPGITWTKRDWVLLVQTVKLVAYCCNSKLSMPLSSQSYRQDEQDLWHTIAHSNSTEMAISACFLGWGEDCLIWMPFWGIVFWHPSAAFCQRLGRVFWGSIAVCFLCS